MENSPKKNKTTVESGVVVETLKGATFRVKMDSDGREILCYPAGKMRMYRIKVLPGDKVSVELSPYDPNRGRVIRRL